MVYCLIFGIISMFKVQCLLTLFPIIEYLPWSFQLSLDSGKANLKKSLSTLVGLNPQFLFTFPIPETFSLMTVGLPV
jgi:hypothetical protein